MTDDNSFVETRVRRALIAYADAAAAGVAADHHEIARRARARSRSASPVVGLILGLVVVGAVALLGRGPVLNTGTDLSRAGAPSCEAGDWPATANPCHSVFRLGNQAGARVEQASIWLTTLGAVKSSMAPRQQVTEPAETAEVWIIVYDGYWRCCPHAFDENGDLIPQRESTRWLVVAEAARDASGFIYLQDWSGKSVPTVFPRPDR